MESLVFLIAAAALISIGTAVVLVRGRQPKGMNHGILEFQREMKALSAEARRGLGAHVEPARGVEIRSSAVFVRRLEPTPEPPPGAVLEAAPVPEAEQPPADVPAPPPVEE